MVEYDILAGKETVGTVCVATDGLYTQFRCRCGFLQEGIYRIIAHYGEREIDLGICIPVGNTYTNNTKVATKYLTSDIPSFYMVRSTRKSAVFIPVAPNEKVCQITKLPEARFHIRAGQKGLLLCEL